MDVATLSKIERNIYQLSFKEQLWLIEKVIQRMRDSVNLKENNNIEYELTDMANDPEIREEIIKIGEEFNQTESDGLETA